MIPKSGAMRPLPRTYAVLSTTHEPDELHDLALKKLSHQSVRPSPVADCQCLFVLVDNFEIGFGVGVYLTLDGVCAIFLHLVYLIDHHGNV